MNDETISICQSLPIRFKERRDNRWPTISDSSWRRLAEKVKKWVHSPFAWFIKSVLEITYLQTTQCFEIIFNALTCHPGSRKWLQISKPQNRRRPPRKVPMSKWLLLLKHSIISTIFLQGAPAWQRRPQRWFEHVEKVRNVSSILSNEIWLRQHDSSNLEEASTDLFAVLPHTAAECETDQWSQLYLKLISWNIVISKSKNIVISKDTVFELSIKI